MDDLLNDIDKSTLSCFSIYIFRENLLSIVNSCLFSQSQFDFTYRPHRVVLTDVMIILDLLPDPWPSKHRERERSHQRPCVLYRPHGAGELRHLRVPDTRLHENWEWAEKHASQSNYSTVQ